MKRITALFAILITTLPLYSQTLSLSGTVTDSAGTTPIAGATVTLQISGQTTTTDAAGKFTLSGTSAISSIQRENPQAQILNGSLMLSMGEKSLVTVSAFSLQGREIYSRQKYVEVGSHSLALPYAGPGIGFYLVKSGIHETVVKVISMDGASRGAALGNPETTANSGLAKQMATSAALYDVIMVSKSGYQKAYLNIANSDSSGIKIKLLKQDSEKFSFFVTSLKALQDLSGSASGFGGDYRFGLTGPGAGLRGADKLCAAIAERSMPGSSVKGWRAFLSVTADASGKQVNAIDRVGPGPWYDRTGKLLAPTKADLLATRPQNGDVSIQNDLPNENGIPNHKPDPNKAADDNHHTITGSNAAGVLDSPTATCKDWTVADGAAENGKPAHGYSWIRGAGMGGAPGGPGGAGTSGSNWMTTGHAFGCAPGVQIVETGPGNGSNPTIGEGGGYGGFYCFALNP